MLAWGRVSRISPPQFGQGRVWVEEKLLAIANKVVGGPSVLLRHARAVAPQERSPRVTQHRSSLVEQRGARRQRHGRLHGEGAALLALQVPRVGPPRPRLPLDGTLLCRRRAHLFALCNHMFGDAQLSALADYVQGSLMLRAIKRFH
jgi:hypothetical protein